MSVSQTFHKTINPHNARAPLVFVQIDHAQLPAPVRVVNDNQDWTVSGILWRGFPFRFKPPEQADGQLPRITLEIDNVGKELMTWLEVSRGGSGATVTLYQATTLTPAIREIEFILNVVNITANNNTVSIALGYEDIFEMPLSRLRYDPATAPGLFEG